jgi:hypothetical protein
VQPTTDGGYILGGLTWSTSAGQSDFWLIKTDANGNEVWSRTFGREEEDEAYSVQQTTDGGYVLAGFTRSFGAGSPDAWLVKTDANGNEIWNRTYGGTGNDRAFSLATTVDGGYVLAGWTTSSGAGGFDAWLIKADANGNEVWSQTFGSDTEEGVFSVQPTLDGGFVLAGDFYLGEARGRDAWLIKTDADGNEVWSRTFGGENDDHAMAVHPTPDGGYVLAGDSSSFGAEDWDAWLVKADSNGNELWQRAFGGSDWEGGNSVQPTADGGYILSGYTESFGAGSSDAWLVKTNADGLVE